MNVQDVINQTIEESFEWLEMADDSSAFLMNVLANKIIKLNEHIEYLERRLNHELTNK